MIDGQRNSIIDIIRRKIFDCYRMLITYPSYFPQKYGVCKYFKNSDTIYCQISANKSKDKKKKLKKITKYYYYKN